jgi:tetratricopeptide (TPR) repeat protein
MAPPSLDLISQHARGPADVFMLRAHYERARDAYIRAYDLYPGHGDIAYNAAAAAYRLGRIADMSEHLNLAILLRPHDTRVLQLGAAAHMRQQEFGRAAAIARRSLDAWPVSIEAHKALASAFNMGNDLEAAAEVLRACLALSPPGDIEAALRVRLAELYEGPLAKYSLAIEQYELAVQKLDRGLTRDRANERLKELKRRVERERLEREGKPIPPHLQQKEEPHNHLHIPGVPHDHPH